MTTGKDRDLLFEATINNGSLSIPRLVNMFFLNSVSRANLVERPVLNLVMTKNQLVSSFQIVE